MHRIQIKRVYEAPSRKDGYRILVDRLWPRGLRKEDAFLDEWNRAISPTSELRKWFAHRPERFKEFTQRYIKELKANTMEVDKNQGTHAQKKYHVAICSQRP